MAGKKKKQKALSTDIMIEEARAFQYVVRKLEKISEPEDSAVELIWASAAVNPILLSLATEIALKAWLYRENNGYLDHKLSSSHDLLELFEGLEKDTQTRLEAKMPEIPNPRGGPPLHKGLRSVLCFHKAAFIRWRYRYEDLKHLFNEAELGQALTVIIEAYEPRQA